MDNLTMNQMQSIKMDLPTATQATRDFKPDIINIDVDKRGEIYIEKKPVNVVELRSFLSNKFHMNTNGGAFATMALLAITTGNPRFFALAGVNVRLWLLWAVQVADAQDEESKK